MPSNMRGAILACLGISICSTNIAAQTVWSGLTFSFSKPAGADGTDPQYRDAITPNIVFARDDTGGLYNAATETSFINGTSPESTEWATDINNVGQTIAATNYADLTFVDFSAAYGHSVGNNIIGRSAVIHLVEPEDIYFDIKFTSWTTGHQFPEGGFAYMRSQPPAPEPSGDYNGDGTVDAADYTIWRDTLGQNADPHGSGADGIADGIIDQQDYAFWKTRFGEQVATGAGSLSAIPEPSAWLLFLGGSLIMTTVRKLSPRGPGQTF